MAKRWYVLNTYSGYEQKVYNNLMTRIKNMDLQNNVFKVQIPTERIAEIKEGGERVEKDKKVLPGYILVQMELDDESWAAVRNTPGVTSFVGSGGKPSPLTREEYNKIMHRSGNKVASRTSTSFEVGQTVKVVSGPLADWDGTITEIMADSGKVKINVSILGRETPTELSISQIAKI